METIKLYEMEIIKVHKKCFDMIVFASDYVMNFFERAKQNNEIEKYTFTFEIYKNGYNIMVYSLGLPFNGDGLCDDYVYSIYANVIDSSDIKLKFVFGGFTKEVLLNANDSDGINESKIIEAIENNIKQLDKFNKQLKAI
jgi:hypothetical protein